MKNHFEQKTFLTKFVTVLMATVTFLPGCSKGGDSSSSGDHKPIAPLSTNGPGGGTSDGGGGQGISCDASVANPQLRGKVLLRDIYEAIVEHKLTMKKLKTPDDHSEKSHGEAIEMLAQTLREFFGPAQLKLDFTQADFWKEFEKKIVFIDDNTSLYTSNDANSPMQLLSGCKIVQIAFWNDVQSDGGILYVSKSLWNSLNELNRVALLAHEYFFKESRQAGDKNSDFIRSKIGLLFSNENPNAKPDQWDPVSDPRLATILPESNRGYRICEGTSREDSTAKMVLYEYQGKDNLQHLNIPYLRSATVNLNFFDQISHKFDTQIEQILPVVLDLWASDFRDDSYFAFASRGIFDNFRLSNPYRYLAKLTGKYDTWDNLSWTKTDLFEKKQIDTKIEFYRAGSHLKLSAERDTAENLVKGILSDILGEDIHDNNGRNIIVLLDQEVEQAIKNAREENNFPKWKELFKTHQFRNSSFSAEANDYFVKLAQNELPTYLYRAKAHTLSSDDMRQLTFYGLMVEDARDFSARLNSSASKKVTFKQGDKQVAFFLTCSSYSENYKYKFPIRLRNTEIENRISNPTPLVSEIVANLTVPNIMSKGNILSGLSAADYFTFVATSSKFIISSCDGFGKTYDTIWPSGADYTCLALEDGITDVVYLVEWSSNSERPIESAEIASVTSIPFYKERKRIEEERASAMSSNNKDSKK
jgi:hypothetical protein